MKATVVSLDGVLSAPFVDVLQTLGFAGVVVDSDSFDPFTANPHAVVLDVGRAPISKLQGRLARLLEPVLDSGAIFILSANDAASFSEASRILHQRAKVAEPKRQNLNLEEIYPTARLIRQEPMDFAQLIRDHVSGLPFDLPMTVEGDTTSATQSDLHLLRRAFSGFTKIVLAVMDGGRSGSAVWQVEASLGSHCCEPFIAKVGSRAAVEDEINTWKRFVLDDVPFPYRSPPVEDRIVQGARRAVLVSRFVDRATRFDDYVTQVNDPGAAVAALFNGALRTWRSNAQPASKIHLGRSFVEEMEEDLRQRERETSIGRIPRSILPAIDRLQSAFDLARKAGDVPSPQEIVDRLRRLRSVSARACRAHGDLNARNLFVTWSGSQIVLIDFSHAILPAYLSRDPSRLEVSVAFDVAKVSRANLKAEYLTPQDIEWIYNVPLLPCIGSPRRQDGRIEAIHQIRRHVIGEGITNEEYSVTTACHLLRVARDPRKGGDGELSERARMRALSYRLAAQIIGSLPFE